MARVVVARRALAQFAEALTWWHEHRAAAPGLLEDELRKAIALLAVQPLLGTRARSARLVGVRRLHLASVRYHLYYRTTGDGALVEILALSHASRGATPQL